MLLCLISTFAGASPDELMEAVKSANPEKTAEILETDPRSVNTLNADGEAPMHWAAISGQLHVIEVLINNNADVNIRTTDNWTPLHWAILKNHIPAAELLIKHKADINAQTRGGWTPLHVAAYKEHNKAIQLLIANGADPNIKDQNDKTPIQTLAEKAMQTMEILIDGGANPPEEETPSWSPLAWIARRSERAREKSELKQKAAELDIKTRSVEELQKELETELEEARKERSETIKKLHEKYRTAAEEKERENALLTARLEEAETQYQALYQKTKDSARRHETDRKSIAKLNEQLKTEMDARLQLERALAELTVEYEEKRAKLPAQTTEHEATEAPFTEQTDVAKKQIDKLQAEIDELQAKLDHAVQQNETLKASQPDTRIETEKELEEAREMKKTLLTTFEQQKKELEKTNAKMAAKQTELGELKEKVSKLQWAAMNNEASHRSAASELKKITAERDALQASLQAARKDESSKKESELKNAYDKLNAALNTISNQQTELDKTEAKIQELEKERDMARNMLNSMETRIKDMPDASELLKLKKLVAELEKNLRESGKNMERLRKQLIIASRERSELELRLKQMAAGRE